MTKPENSTILQFVAHFPPYFAPEQACFPSHEAKVLVEEGYAIDTAWLTAGKDGGPLVGDFMAGNPHRTPGWTYQGPPVGEPIPASFLGG